MAIYTCVIAVLLLATITDSVHVSSPACTNGVCFESPDSGPAHQLGQCTAVDKWIASRTPEMLSDKWKKHRESPLGNRLSLMAKCERRFLALAVIKDLPMDRLGSFRLLTEELCRVTHDGFSDIYMENMHPELIGVIAARIPNVNMPQFFLEGIPDWTRLQFTTQLAIQLGPLQAFLEPANPRSRALGGACGTSGAVLHPEDAAAWRTIRSHSQDKWRQEWRKDPCSYPASSGTEDTAFLRVACVVVAPCVLRIAALVLKVHGEASYEETEATWVATQRLASLRYLSVTGVLSSPTVTKAALEHGWSLPGPFGLRALHLIIPCVADRRARRATLRADGMIVAIPRLKIQAGRSLESLHYSAPVGGQGTARAGHRISRSHLVDLCGLRELRILVAGSEFDGLPDCIGDSLQATVPRCEGEPVQHPVESPRKPRQPDGARRGGWIRTNRLRVFTTIQVQGAGVPTHL